MTAIAHVTASRLIGMRRLLRCVCPLLVVILTSGAEFWFCFWVHVFPTGSRRHGKERALAPSGNVVKCFCALVVTAKRTVNELFSQPVVGFWGLRPQTLT